MKVFMTGGAGFLGRAVLADAVASGDGVSFTIFSRDEGKHARTRAMYPNHQYILGDIRDEDRLTLAMAGHDIVLHLAAMKYVPQGESNVFEAIGVNVAGSMNVARAAIYNRVKSVVGISTDKACMPVNVYGVTKMMMERLFMEADRTSPTNFTIARYGNVVGSTGSVIPIFRRQAREQGRLTLTNPAMTRFWLTVEDAVELIQTALVRPGGTITVPQLQAQSLGDTATAAIFAELGPHEAEDMPRDLIGHRPGEKVHEDLISRIEAPYATEMDDEGPPAIMPEPVERPLQPYNSNHPHRHLSIPTMVEWIRRCPD